MTKSQKHKELELLLGHLINDIPPGVYQFGDPDYRMRYILHRDRRGSLSIINHEEGE